VYAQGFYGPNNWVLSEVLRLEAILVVFLTARLRSALHYRDIASGSVE